MKLRANEVEAIKAGVTELRRPVRTRHGKPLKCGIRRGTVLEDDTICAHVVSEPKRAGSEWVFRVEANGTWAAKADRTDELGIAELEDILPGVLSWDELPDIQVGDKIVFASDKIRDPNKGFIDKGGVTWPDREPINVDVPRLYIEITSLGRNKQGKHVAHFKKVGFQHDEYLAFKAGNTKNKDPEKCLDTEASVVKIHNGQTEREQAESLREHRRLQMLRAEHHRQIPAARGKQLVRLTLSLADVEKKLRDTEHETMEAA